MRDFDLAIRNGRVMTPLGIVSADIGIADGRIRAVRPRGTSFDAHRTLDAAGCHVLPGAIDCHVHIRAPAYAERATVASETAAAAAGGVTTVLEMPISDPCCATAALLVERRAHFAGEALVNFGLYGAPAEADPAELRAMCDAGVIAFKLFMTAAPVGREREFAGLVAHDAATLLVVQEAIAATGRLLVVHAEQETLLRHFAAALPSGQCDAAAHLASRPAVAEAAAIAQCLAIAQATGARLHIAHVSSRAGAAVLRAFQAIGVDATGETCPHYLLFDHADAVREGGFAKVNPPLRSRDDRAALCEAVADGAIAILASDHAPFLPAEKRATGADILRAPPGVAGLETLLLTALDAVVEGWLTLERAVASVTTNPARRFGLDPRKGRVAVGADADLVIVDLAGTTTIDRARLHTNGRDSERLTHGRTFRAAIRRTIVGGAVVFDEGAIAASPGSGRFVCPEPAYAAA